jgi:DNA-binding transcriptional MerR regulator
MDLLRKKDLHPAVEMPKSTVADWIEDFNIFIPKVKHGNVIYYKPESIDVLLFIKQCREQNYHKQQIMELLSEKGFPITVKEAVEDVKRALEGDTPRDTLLAVMQTMGQTVAKIAEQDERLQQQDERLNGQGEALKTLQNKQSNQDGRIERLEKRTDEIDYLKQQIQDLQKELAAAQEKKGFWARIFNKK